MKVLELRTWDDDFEIVYEIKQPYRTLFKHLSALAEPVVDIQVLDERWHRDAQDDIDIEISFSINGHEHTIWTPRFGDYLNTAILFLLNKQLPDTAYFFIASSNEQNIWYLNKSEEQLLKAAGTVMDELSANDQFDFLLYNVLQNLAHGSSDFTYQMLYELAEQYESFAAENAHQKYLEETRRNMREQLLPHINFDKAVAAGVNLEKLYAFTG